MKKILLFSILFALSMTLFGQINTWTGNVDNNWSNVANWSLNAVPTAANDVVIPTGKTVNLNVPGTTKSIVVQGNSTLNINNSLSFANSSSFGTNTIVNWSVGSLNGDGTLSNNGTLNFVGGNQKNFGGATVINNAGTMNYNVGTGNLYVFDTATINNQASGIIDFKTDVYAFYPGNGGFPVLNNAGLIRKTGGVNTTYISIDMINSGTISVTSGTLTLDIRDKTFNGGIYTATSGSTLNWNSLTNVSGTLTGAVAGNVNWNNIVSVATTAIFNFSGTNALSLGSATLNGNGTLTNTGTLNFIGGNQKNMGGTTVLNNAGTMTFKSGSGNFYLFDSATINNDVSGIIDINTDVYAFYPGNGGFPVLNNAGLVRKSGGANTSYISIDLVNSGTINVSSGALTLDIREKTFNGGIYSVSAGNSLNWSSVTNVSGTLTGNIAGNINWDNIVSVAQAATFNFTGTNALSFNSGSLNGDGILTNIGTINFVNGNQKNMGGATTLNNSGTMNFKSGSGNFYIFDTAQINNLAGGIIDFKGDSYAFYPGNGGIPVLNNAGIIKKTAGTATTYLSIDLVNSGTINVNTGTISLDIRQKTLNGGVYNVSSDSTLAWNATINTSNTLTGVVNGTLLWNNVVAVATTATFNFSGNSGISFASGSLNGDGILTNTGIFNFVGGGQKNFGGATVFNNQGLITYQSGAGNFYMFDSSIFNNESQGVFDIKTDAYIFYPGNGGAQMVNNMGLFKKSEGNVITYITEPFVNSGTIDASSGTLLFTNGYNFINTLDGIIKGTATLTLPSAAYFTNNGTFAPGGSPGTLTVIGDYKSSTTSVLDVELNGLTSGTQYDVLAITGTDAIFDGSVNVRLGFAANLNDEFIVATTTGTISQCTLATTTSADFNGMTYTFDVFCRNNNQVVLGVTNITLGVDNFELSDSSIQLYPNPVRNILTIKNVNNLELDNAQITDITGKVISTFDLKDMGLTKEISLENLSSGMYFVRINGLNNSITKRVVKQ
jgi:hypothetical protein